ncbi:MAG: O-antigen ligase family protein [Bacteroidetes bacterium]|nr:O-antigen ligase family protein [Bacteroidota bacterium]
MTDHLFHKPSGWKDFFQQGHFILLLAIAFVMPLYWYAVNMALFLTMIVWIVEGQYATKFRRILYDTNRWWLLSFTLLVFLYVAGLIHTSNMSYGGFDIQTKLGLFFIPLYIATMDDKLLSGKRLRMILASFVAGMLVSSLFCWIRAIIRYSETHVADVFYYSDFSFFHHSSYFAMYAVFAMAVVIWFLFQQKDLSKGRRILLIMLLTYFQCLVFFLSSKAGVISMTIVLFLTVAYLVYPLRKYKPALVFGFIIPLTYLFYFYVIPRTFSRIDQTRSVLESTKPIDQSTSEGTAVRMMIWDATIDLIKEQPLTGTGTGDIKDELIRKYQEKNILNALETKLNAHNQYLQTFAAIGILGFLILAGMQLIPLAISLSSRDFLYLSFLAIFIINSLVESTFETQAGVIFYAFFNSLLFWILLLEFRLKVGHENSFTD